MRPKDPPIHKNMCMCTHLVTFTHFIHSLSLCIKSPEQAFVTSDFQSFAEAKICHPRDRTLAPPRSSAVVMSASSENRGRQLARASDNYSLLADQKSGQLWDHLISSTKARGKNACDKDIVNDISIQLLSCLQLLIKSRLSSAPTKHPDFRFH